MRILKQSVVPKNAKEMTLWVIQSGAENQDNHRGDPLATSKVSGESLTIHKQNSKTKLQKLWYPKVALFGSTRCCFLVR